MARRALLALLLATQALAVHEAHAQAAAANTAAAFLPDGVVAVDLMELRAPERFTALLTRLQAAAQADPEWWRTHVADAEPGEPLPYDARMGLSEDEYAEMLALSGQLILAKHGDARLTVAHHEDGAIRLDGGSALPELTGITFAADGATVDTPLGALVRVNDVHQDDPNSPTGIWTGPQWQGEEIDARGENGRTASLALGRRESDGRMILYFTGKVIDAGRVTQNVTRVVFFDSPASAQ